MPKGPKGEKRPADVIGNAVKVMRIATGEVDEAPSDDGKDAAAVNRRFTRLTNAFSKKCESHVHMVALNTVFYNWTRIHKTLRVTPAMAAGLTDRVWDMADLVALMDAAAPKPGRPVTYKKRDAAILN